MPEYKFTAHYHCVGKPFNVDAPAIGNLHRQTPPTLGDIAQSKSLRPGDLIHIEETSDRTLSVLVLKPMQGVNVYRVLSKPATTIYESLYPEERQICIDSPSTLAGHNACANYTPAWPAPVIEIPPKPDLTVYDRGPDQYKIIAWRAPVPAHSWTWSSKTFPTRQSAIDCLSNEITVQQIDADRFIFESSCKVTRYMIVPVTLAFA